MEGAEGHGDHEERRNTLRVCRLVAGWRIARRLPVVPCRPLCKSPCPPWSSVISVFQP